MARAGLPGGLAKVVLAGHSLGASKTVTYMGTHQDEHVAALISASGPLRMWERLVNDSKRIRHAEQLVNDGRGEDLLAPDAGGRARHQRANTRVAREVW